MIGVVAVIVASLCGSNALKLSGDCLATTSVETLDLNSLAGTWYELASYGMPFTHRMERCHSTTITPNTDGKGFVMTNDRIVKIINKHITTKWNVEGTESATGEKKLTGELTLKLKLPFIGSVDVPFKVLGSDNYKNYIIFHSCYSFGALFKANLAFVLTKKRHYEAKELESLYASIDETLTKNSLTRSKFTLANQIDCEEKKSTSPTGTDSSVSTQNTPTTGEASSTLVEEAKTTEQTEDKTASSDQQSPSETEKSETSTPQVTEASEPQQVENLAAPATEDTTVPKTK